MEDSLNLLVPAVCLCRITTYEVFHTLGSRGAYIQWSRRQYLWRSWRSTSSPLLLQGPPQYHQTAGGIQGSRQAGRW